MDANKEIALPEEEVAKIHGTQFEVENRLIWVQCDQIGRVLTVLGKKFSYKSSQNIWWLFWAILNDIIFKAKPVVATTYFWAP